nr:MAG TPA: hypothetical protein [Caudoviricetes sp.]
MFDRCVIKRHKKFLSFQSSLIPFLIQFVSSP